MATDDEARHEYGIPLAKWEDLPRSAALVYAVAHHDFSQRPIEDYLSKLAPNGVVIDVKGQVSAAAYAPHGIGVWRL